jgi:hypothetical protein
MNRDQAATRRVGLKPTVSSNPWRICLVIALATAAMPVLSVILLKASPKHWYETSKTSVMVQLVEQPRSSQETAPKQTCSQQILVVKDLYGAISLTITLLRLDWQPKGLAQTKQLELASMNANRHQTVRLLFSVTSCHARCIDWLLALIKLTPKSNLQKSICLGRFGSKADREFTGTITVSSISLRSDQITCKANASQTKRLELDVGVPTRNNNGYPSRPMFVEY